MTHTISTYHKTNDFFSFFPFSGPRPKAYGKPKTIPATKHPHIVQLRASRLQCLAVLRGMTKFPQGVSAFNHQL